jgi:hypothetical protein
MISAGLTDNIWIDFIVLPAVLALILTFVFRSPILKIEKWAFGRKKEYKEYETDKTLQDKITKARIKEILKKKEEKHMDSD